MIFLLLNNIVTLWQGGLLHWRRHKCCFQNILIFYVQEVNLDNILCSLLVHKYKDFLVKQLYEMLDGRYIETAKKKILLLHGNLEFTTPRKISILGIIGLRHRFIQYFHEFCNLISFLRQKCLPFVSNWILSPKKLHWFHPEEKMMTHIMLK